MRNIRMIYRYDGSQFFGFQRQINKRTVQGEIEKLLNVVLREKINMISSGRTDRGVHALKQVSNFKTSSSIPVDRLKFALVKGLPEDIEVLEVEEVEEDFHSRFDAKDRGYRYIISFERNPFRARYETYIDRRLDIDRFSKILEPLVGEHDFNNFRMSDCGSKTSVRTIYSIEVIELEKDRIAIDIKGNSFLKSQIRIIMGTALDVYFGLKSKNIVEEMLANPDKQYLKKVAPSNGLYLSEINY